MRRSIRALGPSARRRPESALEAAVRFSTAACLLVTLVQPGCVAQRTPTAGQAARGPAVGECHRCTRSLVAVYRFGVRWPGHSRSGELSVKMAWKSGWRAPLRRRESPAPMALLYLYLWHIANGYLGGVSPPQDITITRQSGWLPPPARPQLRGFWQAAGGRESPFWVNTRNWDLAITLQGTGRWTVCRAGRGGNVKYSVEPVPRDRRNVGFRRLSPRNFNAWYQHFFSRPRRMVRGLKRRALSFIGGELANSFERIGLQSLRGLYPMGRLVLKPGTVTTK